MCYVLCAMCYVCATSSYTPPGNPPSYGQARILQLLQELGAPQESGLNQALRVCLPIELT